MKNILKNILFIILWVIGVFIIKFPLSLVVPDLSIQSYFWNIFQALVLLFSLFISSFFVAYFSWDYWKINTLILWIIFTILNSMTLSMYGGTYIMQFTVVVIFTTIVSIPVSYLAYIVYKKTLWKPTKISMTV